MFADTFEALPPILNDVVAAEMLYAELNVIVPDSLEMVMPPPLPAIVLAPTVASLKLYVPELPLMLMPVLVPLVVTWPLKLMVWLLLDAMVTTFAPLAWLMVPPQVIVPPPRFR